MATTGASLQPIYERLNAMKQHHPLGAETFADWSMEAGDTVTVTRDGKEYQRPVHTSTLVWKGGAPRITVNSTGNEKRDPLTKLERRNFGRGGGGVRVAKKQFTYEVNQEHLWYEVMDENGKVSRLSVDVDGLNHEVFDADGHVSKLQNTVNGLHHEVYDKDGKVSTLDNTVDGLNHEVYDPGGLKTTLTTHAGYFNVLCEGKGNNFHIKPASIQASINADNKSVIQLSADHVKLSGTTMLNDVMIVTGDAVGFKKPAIFMNNLNINSPYILNAYDVVLQGSSPVTLNSSAMQPVINAVRISGPSGNQYTLQYKTLSNSNWQDAGNFSRAVTSWLVGGGSGRINVTALPQNQMKSVNVSVDGTTSISSNGTYTFRAMYENLDGDDMPTGASKTVNVNVHPNSISMTNAKAGRTSSGTDLYYGVLYYWDDDDGSYQPASSGSKYWYYASSRFSGTTTFYY